MPFLTPEQQARAQIDKMLADAGWVVQTWQIPTEAEIPRQEGRDYESADALLKRIQSGRRDTRRPSETQPKDEPEQLRLV